MPIVFYTECHFLFSCKVSLCGVPLTWVSWHRWEALRPAVFPLKGGPVLQNLSLQVSSLSNVTRAILNDRFKWLHGAMTFSITSLGRLTLCVTLLGRLTLSSSIKNATLSIISTTFSIQCRAMSLCWVPLGRMPLWWVSFGRVSRRRLHINWIHPRPDLKSCTLCGTRWLYAMLPLSLYPSLSLSLSRSLSLTAWLQMICSPSLLLFHTYDRASFFHLHDFHHFKSFKIFYLSRSDAAWGLYHNFFIEINSVP